MKAIEHRKPIPHCDTRQRLSMSEPRYLPPHSPDMNPTEKAYSELTKGAGWLERRFDPAPVLVVLLFDQIAGGAGEPDHLCV